jgi:hypothetical protein
MGQFDEVKLLSAEALDILKSSMGTDHPNTKTVGVNRARFLRAHFPDDPALAELEATFGPDIGK